MPSRRTCAAVLASLAAARCVPAPTLAPAPAPAAASDPPPAAPHRPAPEATTANAGAARCQLRGPSDLGALAPGGVFAVGFGDRGGLAVWAGPGGARARPLTAFTEPAGAEVALALPKDAAPREVVPVAGGFVVLAQRLVVRPLACASRCVDATCSSWPAGTPQPHVCYRPCLRPCPRLEPVGLVAQRTDSAGCALGAWVPLQGGPFDIEAVIPGTDRAFALVTGKDFISIHLPATRAPAARSWAARAPASGALEVTRSELPAADYALPVRGSGPPTLLLLDEGGALRVVGPGGVRSVQGNFTDALSGRLLDARLQARWGPDGRIHVARQVWLSSMDTLQYAVLDAIDAPGVAGAGGALDHLALRPDGAAERGALRPPFAEYIEPHGERGRFRRRTWLQRTVGEDIDLREADPDASDARARIAWSGEAFAITYAVPRGGVAALRAVAADCSGASAGGDTAETQVPQD
ncbi:hypothetical protein [Sorangium sp. So ce131]|uniref:hypothetical protein n=1 Tax=Sorangium sp. So ce131 TaxID=3133282 RepID=UPI003F640304